MSMDALNIELDLSTALPADSGILEIRLPGSDKPTGWKIELAGPAHAKTIALGQDLARERLRKEAQAEAAQVNGRKYKPDLESVDERNLRNVTRIVQRIVGWSMHGHAGPIFKQVSPEPIAFSEKTAVDLLMRPDMGWVLGQIADYLTSEAAFTQGSVQS